MNSELLYVYARLQVERCVNAMELTIENNLHLADGDNCTLRDLKLSLVEAKKFLDNTPEV